MNPWSSSTRVAVFGEVSTTDARDPWTLHSDDDWRLRGAVQRKAATHTGRQPSLMKSRRTSPVSIHIAAGSTCTLRRIRELPVSVGTIHETVRTSGSPEKIPGLRRWANDPGALA